MAILTRKQVIDLASGAGVPYRELATAGAICEAESGRNTDAVGLNRAPNGLVLSRDRGLWQINNAYHPDVTDACAFDPFCNAQAMYRISRFGTNWTPWTTFNTGSYLNFKPAYVLEIYGPTVTPAPAPTADGIIGGLQDKVRRGYPLWKAILETVEAAFAAAGHQGADLGSRFF